MTDDKKFTKKDTTSKRILCHCPTMRPDAEALAAEKGYELAENGSASEAFATLSRGEADYALVGRKAYDYELPQGAKETILRSGATLIAPKKMFIEYNALPSLRVHSYTPVTEGLFPKGTEIVMHSSKEEALANIRDGPVLLLWEDWGKGFPLLVVIDGSKKARQFRGAFLYSL